jgi:nucleotide-binding universal stress UspA family protein
MTPTILTHPEAGSGPATDDPPTTFNKVLVGVDGTATGRDAIALGEMLRDPDGQLILARIVPVPNPGYRNFHSSPAGRRSREMLERERAATRVSAELTGMFAPSVGRGLHQLAEDIEADLLVVGSSASGSAGRLLRGDNTQGTLSGAGCAVAIAPPRYAEESRRIETIGVAYNGVGWSRDELLRLGDQVDLLVLCWRGHGPLRRLVFGNMTAHLARSARCPVLVLPRFGAARHAQEAV